MNHAIFARTGIAAATVGCAFGIAVLVAGCQSSAAKKAGFDTAINNFYQSRQDCLWSNPIKFPETATQGNEMQELDALVDAGLLNKTTAKTVRRRERSNEANEYVLSDYGRLVWKADAARAGYGNFCFGPPQVNSIESYKRVNGASATEYQVNYRDVVRLPAWASTPAVKKVFPRVKEDSSGQTATATLIKNGNGWKVQTVSQPPGTPMGS
jgi:hypothetical protein